MLLLYINHPIGDLDSTGNKVSLKIDLIKFYQGHASSRPFSHVPS